MTAMTPTRRPSVGYHHHPPPHRHKTSVCAATAHDLMTEGFSNLELSPATPALSGVGGVVQYVPLDVRRRRTETGLTTTGTVHAKDMSNRHLTPPPRPGTMRSRAQSFNRSPISLPSHLPPPLPMPKGPPPPLPVSSGILPTPVPKRKQKPVPTNNPPPSYHSPTLPPARKVVPLASPVHFASLMLLGTDKIRMAGFPDSCQELLGCVLNKGWTRAEGKKNPAPGVFEWKLAKSPWATDTPLASYRLIEFILFSLSKEGWSLSFSAGMPAKRGARDTFFFMPTERRQRQFFSIVFGTHTVTLLDATDPRVSEEFEQACKTWPRGVGAPYSREHGAFTININPMGDSDTAWPTTGGKYEHAMPQLMCTILQRMALAGYECVTTYDIVDRQAGWHWNDAKGLLTGSMPSIDVWVFAER